MTNFRIYRLKKRPNFLVFFVWEFPIFFDLFPDAALNCYSKRLSDGSCRPFYQKRLQNERHSYNELKYQVYEQVIVSGY